MANPLVAVTMGDPAGVGPESIVGAWSSPAVHQACRPVVVGHVEVIRRAARLVGCGAAVEEVSSPAAARFGPDVISVISACSDDATAVPPAAIDARGGQAAYEALVAGACLAQSGQVAALVTAPLHKAALWRAGHHYPGHTELLAELCCVRDFAMMLYLGPDQSVRGPAGLAIVHVTLHVSLSEALRQLSGEQILVKSRLVDGVMRRLKGARPRIGVCALNPHAGEEGLFGDEETRLIRPAVEQGLAEGLDLVGPMPADTLIAQARDGHYDAVVAMYHDQGHIAIKLLAMHRAVNVTLGLPITRTSVAHGTAFDLAWQGRAEHRGMIEAICLASRLGQTQAP